ncbi:hypothetical protein ACFL02_01370 [Planctomycetota bacterium]
MRNRQNRLEKNAGFLDQKEIKVFFTFLLAAGLSLALTATSSAGPTIYLDADTPATGSLLGVQPLVTGYGTITFAGQIRDRDSDPEFNAAGAFGDVFDIPGPAQSGPQWAQLYFDFDVQSMTFIYGGNAGDILIEARDIAGAVMASLYQADTNIGQPAGPITLSGLGIRSLYWEDTEADMSFAALDNITLTPIPVPGAILLGSLGVGLFGWLRRRRTL